jgi:hypothetical protein
MHPNIIYSEINTLNLFPPLLVKFHGLARKFSGREYLHCCLFILLQIQSTSMHDILLDPPFPTVKQLLECI